MIDYNIAMRVGFNKSETLILNSPLIKTTHCWSSDGLPNI